MDTSGCGKENLMKVISILKTIHEQEKRTFDIQEMVGRGKENVIRLITEQICKLKEASDQKKMCLDLLEQVLDWWDKMVEDRERLLITIADMELDKQQRKMTAKDIYRFQPFEYNAEEQHHAANSTKNAMEYKTTPTAHQGSYKM